MGRRPGEPRTADICHLGHDKRVTGRLSNGRCRVCHGQVQKNKVIRRRAELDAYKMGKGCAQCGYSAHPRALQFHHLDASAKSFNLGKAKEVVSDKKMWAEVRKCIVLCANCHAIATYGE